MILPALDNAWGSLAAGMAADAGVTTLQLTAGHGARFPEIVSPRYTFGLLISATATEKVKVTAHTAAADSMTVVRAVEGSSLQAFAANDRFELRPIYRAVADMHRNIVLDRAANTQITKENLADVIRATAAFTQTLDTAANLGAGFSCWFWNDAGAACTLQAAGGDTINGAGTFTARAYARYWITSDGGTAIRATPFLAGGSHTLWVPAAAMTARTTAGASPDTSELATNKVMARSLAFDAATQQHAQFQVGMPKSWDEGTVLAQFCWTARGGATGNVVWGMQGLCASDDEALDQAFGTGQVVTDTRLADNDVHWSAQTAAITLGGSPAEGDLATFQVYRKAADAADTLSGAAYLLGARVILNHNAADDS